MYVTYGDTVSSVFLGGEMTRKSWCEILLLHFGYIILVGTADLEVVRLVYKKIAGIEECSLNGYCL